jgi:hypothetical protein
MKAIRSIFHILKMVFKILKTVFNKTFLAYIKYHTDRFKNPRSWGDMIFRIAFRSMIQIYLAICFLTIAYSMEVESFIQFKLYASAMTPIYCFGTRRYGFYYLSMALLVLNLITGVFFYDIARPY